MIDIKAVIGANYGDEGKGLITDYFTLNKSKSLVILTNGGAQRGHTVRKNEDDFHIFHHYGSGTLNGADTYCSKFFMINPLVIIDELHDLEKSYHIVPTLFIDSECRFTTPWDMMINQFQSKYEGTHHTCGMGIFNTYKRYKSIYNPDDPYNLNIGSYIQMSKEDRKRYLRSVRNYYNNYNFESHEDYELYWNDNILNNFFIDLNNLIDSGVIIIINDFVKFINHYNNVVFENAQGLLLDWSDDLIYQLYSTPSRTGIDCINELMKGVSDYNLEVCYVTRSYLTRHGDGPLINEYLELMPGIDHSYETNQKNQYQGHLRYGLIDTKNLIDRINKDFNRLDYNAELSLAITHLDEIDDIKLYIPSSNIYASYSPFSYKIDHYKE